MALANPVGAGGESGGCRSGKEQGMIPKISGQIWCPHLTGVRWGAALVESLPLIYGLQGKPHASKSAEDCRVCNCSWCCLSWDRGAAAAAAAAIRDGEGQEEEEEMWSPIYPVGCSSSTLTTTHHSNPAASRGYAGPASSQIRLTSGRIHLGPRPAGTCHQRARTTGGRHPNRQVLLYVYTNTHCHSLTARNGWGDHVVLSRWWPPVQGQSWGYYITTDRYISTLKYHTQPLQSWIANVWNRARPTWEHIDIHDEHAGHGDWSPEHVDMFYYITLVCCACAWGKTEYEAIENSLRIVQWIY